MWCKAGKESMKTEELVFKRGRKWVFREPGYTRWDGPRLLETVEHQDFVYDDEKDARGHAHEYLKPPCVWFPPPPD